MLFLKYLSILNTGKLSEFSPQSEKIHIDIDASSINKNIQVDVGIIGDAGIVLDALISEMKAQSFQPNVTALQKWWRKINEWRSRKCLGYRQINEVIKQRDFWMPFALSILKEFSDEYIVNPKNIKSLLVYILIPV